MGTQEPIYGPTAIQTVAEQAAEVPYTVLTRENLRWKAYKYTNVETQTFYVMAANGTLVMIQVIYSNIACVRLPDLPLDRKFRSNFASDPADV